MDQTPDTFIKNNYDLDINSAVNNLEQQIQANSTLTNKRKKELIKILRASLESTKSELHKTNQPKNLVNEIHTIIDLKDKAVDYWLAIIICSYSKEELPLMLDWQYEKAKKKEFHYYLVNVLENLTFRHIEKQSDYNTNNILPSFVEWVREKRSEIGYHKVDLDNLKKIELKNDSVIEGKHEDDNDTEIDDRIEIGLTLNEVQEYFYKLSKKPNEKKPFLSKKEVEEFVQANFKFGEPIKRKVYDLNIKKGSLRRFVYDFYLNKDIVPPQGRQLEYCHLLIKNFKQFESKNAESLSKDLAAQPPKDHPLR